jgi:hypothetical protein
MFRGKDFITHKCVYRIQTVWFEFSEIKCWLVRFGIVYCYNNHNISEYLWIFI